MKRAQAAEVGAPLLELDVAPHDIDDVDAGEKLMQKTGRNHSGSLPPGVKEPPAGGPRFEHRRDGSDGEIFELLARGQRRLQPVRAQPAAAP